MITSAESPLCPYPLDDRREYLRKTSSKMAQRNLYCSLRQTNCIMIFHKTMYTLSDDPRYDPNANNLDWHELNASDFTRSGLDQR
jgi:hypothetical protein